MGGKKKSISDLVRRIGLLAPLTKSKTHWDHLPKVRTLYETELDQLSKANVEKTNDEIKASDEFRQHVHSLLKKYGPTVWPRVAPEGPSRSWLLKAGDARANGLYPADVFFDDPYDRELIERVFHELAIQKAIRWRNDNHKPPRDRNSSAFSDPTWRPAEHKAASASESAELHCFAEGLPSHDDATFLRERGVWLGKWEDGSAKLGGYESWDEVILGYCERTDGASKEDALMRLHTNSPHHSSETEKSVECAACLSNGRALAHDGREPCRIRNIGLDCARYPDVKRNVWTFLCSLDGAAVYAIIKSETRRRLGSSTALWSFWKADGGYTSDLLLATAPKKSRDDRTQRGDGISETDATSTAVRRSRSPETPRRTSNAGPSHFATNRRSTHRESLDGDERGEETAASSSRTSNNGWKPSASARWQPVNGGRSTTTSKGPSAQTNGANVRKRKHCEAESDEELQPRNRTPTGDGAAQRTSSGTSCRQEEEDRGGASQTENDTIPVSNRRSAAGAGSPVLSSAPKTGEAHGHAGKTSDSGPGAVGSPAQRNGVPTPQAQAAQSVSATEPQRVRLWLRLRGLPGRKGATIDTSTDVQAVFADIQSRLARKLEGKRVQGLSVTDVNGSSIDPIEVEPEYQDSWDALVDEIPAVASGILVELEAFVEV